MRPVVSVHDLGHGADGGGILLELGGVVKPELAVVVASHVESVLASGRGLEPTLGVGGCRSVVVIVVLPVSQKLGVDKLSINLGRVSPRPVGVSVTSWLNDSGVETRGAWLGSLEGDRGGCASFAGDALECG